MRISKKSQYGLRAMVYLAKFASKEKPCSLKKISQAEDIPFDFLEKIMGELEQSGLVKAKKGAGGGYFLAKKPNKITPGEIIRILEETVVPVSCAGCMRARTCLTKGFWEDVGESLDSTFESITLADLIKKK